MNKIKFTAGTLEKISDEYFNLVLTNLGKHVYKATLPISDVANLITKHKDKIKII